MVWDVRYRPLRFGDVLGQEGAVEVLKAHLREDTGLGTSYLFCGGHGQGKCVRGDTLVSTDRGLVPIQALMGPNKIDPLVVGVQQEIGCGRSAYSFRGGQRDTITIRTHLGFELEGTPNHRIRVMLPDGTIGWRALGEIQVGDHACIVRQGLFGVGADLSSYSFKPKAHDFSSLDFEAPRTLNGSWARLMGYMIGDGSCTSRSAIVISCAEPDVRQDALDLLRRLCGDGNETPDKRRPGLSSLRCGRVAARDFLAFLGVDFVGAADKTIPWSIMASPEEEAREFLRGYFESDGSVSGRQVEVVTKSAELARQVQALLLQFGVVARRSPKQHPKYGIFWRLRLTRTSVDVFESRIGFVSKRKRAALAALVRREHAVGRRGLTNSYDVVPFQAPHVARFYASLPKEQRTRETSRLFRCRRGGVSCTSQQVRAIAKWPVSGPEVEHFRSLDRASYVYDPVVRIGTGRCEVFDLNVPRFEMFAANGFMNHNTTLARILARALLCSKPEDGEPCNTCDNCQAALTKTSMAISEMDAASQGTVDNIRSIVDDLPFMVPGARKRVYIFDEAHRMSIGAQDALLKPIEDKEMVAILCTTEPEKIRGPIKSRCEVHQIRKVTREDILKRMRWILEQEKVEAEDDAILTVIDFSAGHVRDILNRLEMVAHLGPITLQAVRERLNLSVVATFYEILLALGDTPRAVALVEQACDRVGSEDVATGLAEAAMNTYRLAHGMHADFSLVDRQLAAKVHEKFGSEPLIHLASFFLQSYHPSKIGLVCDIVRCASGVPAPAKAGAAPPVVVVQTPSAVPTAAVSVPGPALTSGSAPVPTSTLEPAEPAPPQPTQPKKTPVKEVTKPLTDLDSKVADKKMPRGSERNSGQSYTFRGSEGTSGRVGDRRILPASEWRQEFEEAFAPFIPSSRK